jgi:hypothetical protein
MLTIRQPPPATGPSRPRQAAWSESGKSALRMARRRPAKAAAGTDAWRRGGGLRRLPELLVRVLDPAARRRGLTEVRLLTDWPLVIGPELGARCQPVRLSRSAAGHGGVLTVHVGGASALELQHSEPQLLERINDFFGYPAVARLRLIQAPPVRPVKRAAPAPIRPLAADELEGLSATVALVRDPELRAALASLGRAVKAQLLPPDRSPAR